MDEGLKKFNYNELVYDAMYLIEECTKLSHVITASQNSMRILQEIPPVFDGFNKIANQHGWKALDTSNIDISAKIAKKEIDNEFLFFNTQFALMLYAYLEATVKRLIKTFLKTNKHIEVKEITDVQIKLYEYMQLDESDRYEYLYQQYEKKNAIGLLYGLSRFEKLLAPIGLSGDVSKEIGRDIFELSQVRNVIIHNGGIIDRHFVKNCPWLKSVNGEKLLLNNGVTERYYKSVSNYGTILSVRIGNKIHNTSFPSPNEVFLK